MITLIFLGLIDMRVLFLTQYFWPENFQINDVALTLKEKGCKVTVLTGQPNYPEGKIFEGYNMIGLQSENFHTIPIRRVPLIPRGIGAVRLAINYLSFILSASLFGPFQLWRQKFDIVFVYGISPILAALPALFIGWIKSAPVVIWVQDLWPESLSATGYINNKWILKFIGSIVRSIYQRADLLLVQSEAFVKDVKNLAGSTPVVYFPNSVDSSFAQPVTDSSLPLPELKNKFIVLFAGNIGEAQAVETIVEAADLLQSSVNIHFVLVGDGSQREWVQRQVQERGLLNVSLPGNFPLNEMPAFMKQAAVLLVTLKGQEIFAKTVPNKVQAYLAAGRPIVAALNGEGARVIAQAQAGLTVEAEKPKALA